MSIETAVVVADDGSPIHWHLPPGRSSVHLPDSVDLWSVLWGNRARLAGVAHSHPGAGRPYPSREDVTTFSAVEAALGRRLDWWITSADTLAVFRWRGPDPYDYSGRVQGGEASRMWLSELRKLSYER